MQRAHNFNDLTNKKFGRLTALSYLKTEKKRAIWLCKCDCGNECHVIGTNLKRGNSKSCGCLNIEKVKTTNITHGMAYTVEYDCWIAIKARCYNKNNPAYGDYGERGINVCDRWLASFDNFFTDMGLRPSPELSLHRIDNDKGYSKENCMWATKIIQNGVKRNSRWIEYGSKRMILADWGRMLNITTKRLHKYLTRHSIEDAVKKYSPTSL